MAKTTIPKSQTDLGSVISHDDLRDLLKYNKRTGVFTWRNDRLGHPSGTVAGSLCCGYIQIGLCGQSYLAHRLAWLYVYGAWPNGCIDHKNGLRKDNRIVNLRDVSHCGNMQNLRGPMSNNKAGLMGVRFTKGKWQAEIRTAGVRRYLGRFVTAAAAHAAYISAKRGIHRTCTI